MLGSGSPAVFPRLLNLHEGAIVLGCSFWTLRDYVLQGLIPVVELPPVRAREGERQRKTLRRVLVDREDLDAFIASLKSGRAGDIQTRAPRIEAVKPGRNAAPVPALCPPGDAR